MRIWNKKDAHWEELLHEASPVQVAVIQDQQIPKDEAHIPSGMLAFKDFEGV